VRTKGKGAIDVICNPLGKSGGALIQQFMIVGFGSLAASTPYLGAILLVIIALWINAASTLDGLFKNEQKVRAEKDAAEAAEVRRLLPVLLRVFCIALRNVHISRQCDQSLVHDTFVACRYALPQG
jgi:hypothetical protein